MNRKALIRVAAVGSLVATAVVITMGAPSKQASVLSELKSGKAQLASAGALAFGPEGVLFVGDSIGGSVVALDTQDQTAPKSAVKVNVQGVDAKIAALAGVTPDQIVINDVRVNPVSKNIYISAARGKGPGAAALIARVNTAGEVSLISLDNIRHAEVSLNDVPASDPSARQNPRMMTITDMNYINGNLMVAGLSNEEWSSALRSIPVPFQKIDRATTLQIWHTSHGRYETQSPVRTFVPYTMAGQEYILAAYTCTPLVKIPVSDLKAGSQVKGTTITDLGAGNQPIDMVPYQKDGHDYILIANSTFGLVKVKADNIESYKGMDSPTQLHSSAGMPYDKTEYKNVRQLAQLDKSDAVILSGTPDAPGQMNLATIALP